MELMRLLHVLLACSALAMAVPPKFSDQFLDQVRGKLEVALYPVHTNETVDAVKPNLPQLNWLVRVWRCLRSPSIRTCIRVFMIQRIRGLLGESGDLDPNLTETELDQKLNECLVELHNREIFKLEFVPGVEFDFSGNDTISVVESGKGLKDMMPYAMIPAVLMTTFLPMILPAIKMAVMFVMMMNQMAFSMALMNLVRGLIFDPRPSDEVVYVNHGYKNEYLEHEPWPMHHQPPHEIFTQQHLEPSPPETQFPFKQYYVSELYNPDPNAFQQKPIGAYAETLATHNY